MRGFGRGFDGFDKPIFSPVASSKRRSRPGTPELAPTCHADADLARASDFLRRMNVNTPADVRRKRASWGSPPPAHVY